ncbi:hypothetical protein [Bartonella koehlerae]|uniref:Trimeric autotransporter adhesin YadA-like stalk domain-containing protein n=1 Tax=Bartonella koehlerae C-29 TaxID=1134510 RepID=A0A067WAF0_9HYPH|nr:hypothetical protein [Bartonella koehlerae]KEC55886.1 hypothetical protein O9A_00441 [Bartonella koehlerae C-29]
MQGAVSVGDFAKNITRQIVGVADGFQDSDAINIAQLKSLQDYVKQGRKLSIGGIDGKVDFSIGNRNLEITKGMDDNDDNKVKFDLAKDITLNSIKLGGNTLDTAGLIIKNGLK